MELTNGLMFAYSAIVSMAVLPIYAGSYLSVGSCFQQRFIIFDKIGGQSFGISILLPESTSCAAFAAFISFQGSIFDVNS